MGWQERECRLALETLQRKQLGHGQEQQCRPGAGQKQRQGNTQKEPPRSGMIKSGIIKLDCYGMLLYSHKQDFEHWYCSLLETHRILHGHLLRYPSITPQHHVCQTGPSAEPADLSCGSV